MYISIYIYTNVYIHAYIYIRIHISSSDPNHLHLCLPNVCTHIHHSQRITNRGWRRVHTDTCVYPHMCLPHTHMIASSYVPQRLYFSHTYDMMILLRYDYLTLSTTDRFYSHYIPPTVCCSVSNKCRTHVCIFTQCDTVCIFTQCVYLHSVTQCVCLHSVTQCVR